jgi:hypothetical protein
MRSLALVLPASLMFVAGVYGQALTEHAAAAAGAAIGVGAGKSLSNSMTKIFGDMDKETTKAAKPETKKPSKPVTNPAPDPLASRSNAPVAAIGDAGLAPLPPLGSSSSSQRSSARRKPVLTDETGAKLETTAFPSIPSEPVIAEPIVKVPTVEDIANIKIGTTESDLEAALGQPSSRLTIPDDDGHLRETCQYWANGRALGTIRLDNGQVVTVETRPEN